MAAPGVRVKLTGTACVTHRDDRLLPCRVGVLPWTLPWASLGLTQGGEGGQACCCLRRHGLFSGSFLLPTRPSCGDGPGHLPNKGQRLEVSPASFLPARPEVLYLLASLPPWALVAGFSEPDPQIRRRWVVWLLSGEQEEEMFPPPLVRKPSQVLGSREEPCRPQEQGSVGRGAAASSWSGRPGWAGMFTREIKSCLF